ncbi:hypothetical protein JW859_03190 [bacterium]|nr:hypothetical protein [bacterium]
MRTVMIWLVMLLLALSASACRTTRHLPEPETGTITLSAEYTRLTQELAVSAVHSLGEEVGLELWGPGGVSGEGGPDWTPPADGSALVIPLSFDADEDDTVTLNVQASAPDGATAGTQIAITRSVIVSVDSISFETPGEFRVMVSADFEAGALVDIDVETTSPPGITINPVPRYDPVASQARHAISETGSAIFDFSYAAEDPFAGGVGSATITATATDQYGHADVESTTATVLPPAFSIPTGALAAVPADTRITTADTVTVVVISGFLSTDQPFTYMNGVGVTIEEGASYVDGTLNVGAPGGSMKQVDGIWADMASYPQSFLLPDDFMIQELPSNDAGRIRIDFNVTPIGGSQVTSGGVLFNFQLQFDHAGTYTLGFEEFNLVKRTYYSDTENNEYYWNNISNNYSGVPNSITVT